MRYKIIINALSLIVAPFLLLACSIKRYKIFILYNSRRIGHFALNVDIFLRRIKIGNIEGKVHYFLLSTGKNSQGISNKYLHLMQRRYVSSIPYVHYIASSILYHVLMNIYQKGFLARIFYTDYYDSNEVEFSQTSKVLSFSHDECAKGRDLLRRVGINLDKDKVVCIFARDDAYLKSIDGGSDWSHHSFRDMDVDEYITSIKYLISQGYKVVRVGSIAKHRVNYIHKSFFDYSFSDIKSDFMDLFLIYISHFVVGNSSGMVDLAVLFNKPLLIVNGVPFTYAPLGKKDMYIHKKILNCKTNEIVPFSELLKMDISIEAQGQEQEFRLRYGLKYLDNTSDEICRAIVDMDAYLHGDLNYKNSVKKYYSHYWALTRNKKILSLISPSWLKENESLYYQD